MSWSIRAPAFPSVLIDAHIATGQQITVREFIEWSDEGIAMVPANEAYKLWVNYFVYALTH